MPSPSSPIIIIGAGPAGMAAASELAKYGYNITVVETERAVGGLSKTLEFHEGDLLFRTDIGPHRFFSKNKKLYEFIEGVLGEQWRLVPRKTRQFIYGKFYDYPIKIGQTFRNIGLIEALRMGCSYVWGFLVYRVWKKPILNFEDYIIAHFGERLGRFNMLNYTEKIWGIPSNTIHPDWAKQRIKGLNFVSAVVNALGLGGKKGAPKSLVDEFYYPQYGTGLIYETLYKTLAKKGVTFLFESRPSAVFHKGTTITRVDIQTPSGKKSIENPILISSMPITDFLHLLNPEVPAQVKSAVGKLSWRAQIYLFLTLDKERVTDDNWVYFPDPSVPFGRVSEMKNFSPEMSPQGKTSLFVEFFVSENEPLWKASDEDIYTTAIQWLEKQKLIARSEVRHYYIMRRPKVYPIYDVDYKTHLAKVTDYLDRFSNLLYIGRPGRFRYNNQDHSLEMGFAAAQSVRTGKKADFDAIGGESEYYESGAVTLAKKDSQKKDRTSWFPTQFSLYVLYAGLATIADIAVLTLAVEAFSVPYLWAVAIGYTLGMGVNFTLNRRHTFKAADGAVSVQFPRFLVGALCGLLLNEVVVYSLVEYISLWYLAAKIISVGIVMMWSFWWHRSISFREHR